MRYGNFTEAEGLAQEAFVRAYALLITYTSGHKFVPRLLVLASHLSLDHLSRRFPRD